MSRFSNSKILLIYLLLLALIVFMIPAGTDWSRTYRSTDRKPLDLEVFSILLQNYFDGKVSHNDLPPTEALLGPDATSAYFVVTEHFEPGARSTESFLKYVRQGNELFISAMSFYGAFSDSLGIAIHRHISFPINGSLLKRDSAEVKLVMNQPSGTSLDLKVHRRFSQSYIRYDSLAYDYYLLGEVAGAGDNFMAIRLGEGMIYLHSTPDLFTNYALLYEDSEKYISACLSLIEAGHIILDQYFRPGKRAGISPLRVILSDRSLKWLYYLTIAGLILYAIFGIKRRSRPIKVIERPENKSIEFATTVAGLYFKKASYRELAELRFNALREYLLNHYQLEDLTKNEGGAMRLAEQTGYSEDKLRQIFRLLNESMHESGQFLEFNRQLNLFYQYLNRYKNV